MDYDREIVLVAEVDIPGIGKDLIGVARLSRSRSAKGRAALHLVVADRWQSQGLEAALLEALLAIARTEGLTHLTAEFVEDDRTLRRLLAEQGFIIGDGAGPSRHADLLLN